MPNHNPLPVTIQKYLFQTITQIPTDRFKLLPEKYQKIIIDKQKLKKIIEKSDLDILFDILNKIGINWGIYFIGNEFDLKSELLKDNIANGILSISKMLKNSSSFITTNKAFAIDSEKLAMASEMAFINANLSNEDIFSKMQNANSTNSSVVNRSFDQGFELALSIFENIQLLTSICKSHHIRFTEFVTLCHFLQTPYDSKTRQDLIDYFNPGYGKCISRLHKLEYISKSNNSRFSLTTIGMVTTCNIIGQYIIWVISKIKNRG